MKTALILAASLFATAAHPQTGLTQGPPLAVGIDAFPRLTATDAGALKINAKFAAMDVDEMEWLVDCDGDRGIAVTAETTDFLSLTVERGCYCDGAAHPFHDTEAMTFDRISGDEVDWQVLLPKALLDADSAEFDPRYPHRSNALSAAYLAALTNPQRDCAFAYAGPLDFDFWLDGGQKALALAPRLAFAQTACVEDVFLPVAQLQGADRRLIAALSGAE